MKKLIKNSNPFVLLLIPVLFAIVMGISYQFDQKKEYSLASTSAPVKATSLFFKGVTLVKAVCEVSRQNPMN